MEVITKSELDQIFDNAEKVILEISEEVQRLKSGEHKDKPFVQSKSSQLATLIRLHDQSKNMLEAMHQALRISEAVHRVKDALIMKHETGLSYEKINELTGLLIPSKDQQDLDARILKHIKELNDL